MNIDKSNFYKNQFAKNIFEISDKYQILLKRMSKFSAHNILDIGCGDGSFLLTAGKFLKINKLYGVDISKNGIKEANKANIKAFCHDVDKGKIPLKSNSIDLIFCGEVIEHVYSPDNLLIEIHRLLKPGGHVVLTTPNLASWFNRISLLFGYQPIFSDISLVTNAGQLWPMDPFGHLRLYTYRSLVYLFNYYKFNVEEVFGYGINNKYGFGKKYPLIAKITNLIFKSPKLNSDIILIASKR